MDQWSVPVCTGASFCYIINIVSLMWASGSKWILLYLELKRDKDHVKHRNANLIIKCLRTGDESTRHYLHSLHSHLALVFKGYTPSHQKGQFIVWKAPSWKMTTTTATRMSSSMRTITTVRRTSAPRVLLAARAHIDLHEKGLTSLAGMLNN